MQKISLKNPLFSTLLVVFAFVSFSAFTGEPVEPPAEKVKWYTWEEAIEANAKEPRKLMIDVYTNWCGWCKRMDKATFQDPKVAAYLNKNFYPIKFNAEQRETITYKDHEFKYVAQGRRGVHMLAYSLLDGGMSYPSIVFMDEDQKRIMISKGFKGAKDFMKDMTFAVEEKYKKDKP